MAYSYTKNSSGNYEIFQDGTRISTGSAASLAQYGLSETTQTPQAVPGSYAAIQQQAPSMAYGATNTQSYVNLNADFYAKQAAEQQAREAENTRRNALITQAKSIQSSGTGATGINSFYNNLSGGDQSLVKDIFGNNIQTPTSISNPITPPRSGGSTPGPTLPTPQAGNTADTYTQSLTQQIEIQKVQIQQEADKRSKEYQTKIDTLQKEMDDYQTLQDEGMANMKDTVVQETSAKKAALELERQRFDENYNANQALIGELDGLLTTGNQVIEQMKNTTGLASIMNPRIAKTVSDVQARAGILQMTISARNGQMTYAQQQLGTTYDALSSMATDQINYYKTVIDFYDNQENESRNDVLNLTKDQKVYLDMKLNILGNDLSRLQETSDYVQKLMTTPESALFMAKAGISLNDSVGQINQKMAIQSQRDEVEATKNSLTSKGYTFVPFPGVQGSADTLTVQVGGESLTFKKPAGGGVDGDAKILGSASTGYFTYDQTTGKSTPIGVGGGTPNGGGGVSPTGGGGSTPSTGGYQAGALTKLLQSQGKTADDATLKALWSQYGNGGAYNNDTAHNAVIYNAMGGKVLGGGTSSDPFVQQMLGSSGGKPITDTFAQKIDKGLVVLSQIGSLQANIKNTDTGPLVGLFRGANPWDTNAQTIKAQLNAVVPNLARGVYGEVGVLTDNDIKNYSKTLPTLTSTEDIRNAVLGITIDMIGKSIKNTLAVNLANGKDVSGFVDLYKGMIESRDSTFAQIGKTSGTENKPSSFWGGVSNWLFGSN